MKLSELRQKPHLSASAITGYIDCSLEFFFSRIRKVPRDHTPDVLSFGSSVHKALEEFYHGRMVNQPLTKKALQEVFVHYWEQTAQDNEDIRYGNGKDFNTYLLEGQELLGIYLDKLPKEEFQVSGIEEPFSFLIDGLEIPIIGAMDLIEQDEAGNIIITDFKTSSRLYSNDEAYKNFQLTLYNMAARANGYDDSEILLKLDCLIKTKAPKVDFVWTVRSEEDFQRARMKILRVADGIEKQVFIPNDGHWKCNGCGVKKYCEAWFSGEVQ